MKMITYCENCRRRYACNTRLKELKNQDFPNIIIFANCSSLLLPVGMAVGTLGPMRDQFNHCDDCDFETKCKYYKHPEMLKEIDRVRVLCADRGYDTIKVSCNMHNSIKTETPIQCNNSNTEKKKKMKISLFSRKKEK